MFIRIEAQKVEVSENTLNQEPILIKLENTLKIRPYIIMQLKCYYESDTNLESPFMLGGLPDELGSDVEDLSNFVKAAKFALNLVKDRYKLQDSDARLVVEEVWTEPLRTIRVYIPYKNIIDSYNDLIAYMKSLSVPYHEVDTGYVIYLESILPEHLSLLESDINVLIEYKPSN